MMPERALPLALRRYLIVDDDRNLAATVQMHVARAYPDAQPAYAVSGPEALKLIDQMPDLELVLMDYRMPGMDGLETLKRIRLTHPALPVIMLTGLLTEDLVTETMDAGADDYVIKDHLQQTLSHVIWSVLIRHKAAMRSQKRSDEASKTLLAILRKLRDAID